MTEALAIDPDAEPKLADCLAKLHNQRAILCACDCSWHVCTHPRGMLSDATYNGELTPATRFVLNGRGE